MLDKLNYCGIFWCYKKRSDVWMNFSADSKILFIFIMWKSFVTIQLVEAFRYEPGEETLKLY